MNILRIQGSGPLTLCVVVDTLQDISAKFEHRSRISDREQYGEAEKALEKLHAVSAIELSCRIEMMKLFGSNHPCCFYRPLIKFEKKNSCSCVPLVSLSPTFSLALEAMLDLTVIFSGGLTAIVSLSLRCRLCSS